VENKKMSRKERNIAELQESSNHLHYEFWMFNSLANGLGSGIAGQGPLSNALLESFVIHLRALIDFLYSDKPRDDDVIAEDYFPNEDKWKKIRPEQSETLRLAKRRAGKEIAHLTYTRIEVTSETKPWAFVDISNEICSLFNIFLKNMNRDLLGSQWK
jgi:hypothetical protein